MTDIGASRTVVLVFGGGDPGTADVRRFVGDWAASGLVSPSLWADSDGWEVAGQQLLETGATLITGAESRTGRLVELMGDAVDVVRVVVLHVLASGERGDGGRAGQADALVGQLKTRLGPSTALRVVNLLVPASGIEAVTPALILVTEHATALNVVISPEDRQSDDRIDSGVRSGAGDNLGSHAALALVTAGGLWQGMREGPFDEPPFPSSGGEQILVGRAFASAIQVEPLIAEVTARALQPREEWPLPGSGDPTPPIAALDPVGVVDRMVDQRAGLGEGALEYDPFTTPAQPPPRTIGIMAAFKELFRFLGRRLRGMPREISERIRIAVVEKAERLTQALTYGEGAEVCVRLRGTTPTDLSVGSLLADVGVLLEAVGIRKDTYSAPSPDVWRALRRLSFGLVDGSDLPAGFDRPMGGNHRQVLTQPRLIAPNPFDTDTAAVERAAGAGLGRTVRLPSGDPYAAAMLRAALESHRAQQAVTDERPPEVRQAVAEAATQAIEALDEWTRRRSSSLTWKLGDRLAREIMRARTDLATATAAMVEAEPANDRALERAWRGCKWKWVLAVLLAAGGITLTWIAPFAMLSSVALTWLLAALSFLWIVVAFLGYLRVEFQVLNRREKRRFDLNVAYEQALRASEEIVRLGSLYQQLIDWAEILGGIAHRPWGLPVADPGSHALPQQDDLARALNLGSGTTDADAIASLAAGAARELFDRSWLAETWERFSTWSLERQANLEALSVPPDPDFDTPQAPNGAKSALRRELNADRWAVEAFGRGREAVDRYLREQPSHRLVTMVTPLRRPSDSGGGQPSLSPEAFFLGALPTQTGGYLLSDLWDQRAVAGDGHRVVQRWVWAPTEMLVALGPECRVQAMPEVALPGGGMSIKIVRLDCSAPCTRSDLKLFDQLAGSAPRRRAVHHDNGDTGD